MEDVHKNFTNIMTEYFDENYPSVTKMEEVDVCAKADEMYEQMRMQVRRKSNAKMVPPWGLPMEIWKTLLWPQTVFRAQRWVLGTVRGSSSLVC